ncbi:MAG: DUF2442 domain-containing protein [Candidatus Dormibacteria bacterium]
MSLIPRVTNVEVLDGCTVRLRFKDGTAGEVDLSYLLRSGPVFQSLDDPAYFRRVRGDRTIGTIVWPNGADVAPETLYELARARVPQGTA